MLCTGNEITLSDDWWCSECCFILYSVYIIKLHTPNLVTFVVGGALFLSLCLCLTPLITPATLIMAPPPPKRVKKVMTLPINVIFSHLQVRQVTKTSESTGVFCCWCYSWLTFYHHFECTLLLLLLQNKTRIKLWLYEDTKLQIEGQIIGFDEYMNMTLDDAVEVLNNKRTEIGRILIKGDSISVLQEANPTARPPIPAITQWRNYDRVHYSTQCMGQQQNGTATWKII